MASSKWTFLTNHAHVLVCLARDPQSILKDVAAQVGITERAVQKIVSDLEKDGYIKRRKFGRSNVYQLSLTKKLRHPVERNCSISDLIELVL